MILNWPAVDSLFGFCVSAGVGSCGRTRLLKGGKSVAFSTGADVVLLVVVVTASAVVGLATGANGSNFGAAVEDAKR